MENDIRAPDGNSEAELTQIDAKEHRSFHCRFLIQNWNRAVLDMSMFVISWHFSPFEPTLAEPVVFIWHTPASVFCSETALLRTTRSSCHFPCASVADLFFFDGKTLLAEC